MSDSGPPILALVFCATLLLALLAASMYERGWNSAYPAGQCAAYRGKLVKEQKYGGQRLCYVDGKLIELKEAP